MRRTLVIAVIPLVLAACGGGGKKTSAGAGTSNTSAVESAAAKTVNAGSEKLTLQAIAMAGGQRVTVTGNGAFDSKKRLGSLHVSFSAGSISSALDEVLSGTQLYLKSPLLAAGLPAGKTWLKIDLAKVANASVLADQDPSQALTYLRTLKSVKLVGKDATGTHYSATIDTSKLPSVVAAQLGNATYDVWVGTDGYVHRIKLVTAGSTKVTATSNLSDFGTAVNVTVPPASQTFTTTKIPGLGG